MQKYKIAINEPQQLTIVVSDPPGSIHKQQHLWDVSKRFKACFRPSLFFPLGTGLIYDLCFLSMFPHWAMEPLGWRKRERMHGEHFPPEVLVWGHPLQPQSDPQLPDPSKQRQCTHIITFNTLLNYLHKRCYFDKCCFVAIQWKSIGSVLFGYQYFSKYLLSADEESQEGLETRS